MCLLQGTVQLLKQHEADNVIHHLDCISQAHHQLQTNYEHMKDKVLQTLTTRIQALEQQITVILSEIAQNACVPDIHSDTCECFPRSETVAECIPDQYGVPIVTCNRVFVRKVTTPIPDQNFISLNQNGTLAQSSSGYATGTTSSNAAAQAKGQVPPQVPDIALSSTNEVEVVISGKLHSSDPDSEQVNPVPSGATLTGDTDSPQQPRNQHLTVQPPLDYEPPITESITVLTCNSTVPVTREEETDPPFHGLAPTPFYNMYPHEN